MPCRFTILAPQCTTDEDVRVYLFSISVIAFVVRHNPSHAAPRHTHEHVHGEGTLDAQHRRSFHFHTLGQQPL